MKNLIILLALCVLTLGFSSLAAADQEVVTVTNKYVGPFTNTSFNKSGDVTIDMTIHADNSVSGYINFTQYPSVSTLCGAGNFNGTKTGNSLEFTFISQDPDPGCGFDSGLEFTITATISRNNSYIIGNYYINNGQQGVFRAKTDWPDISALESNYANKIGTNEAAFVHQFFCIASKSCNEYLSTGDAGWAGEFVRFVFEVMIRENGLADSVNVHCDPSDSNVECFEKAASEHKWELLGSFAAYCIINDMTGTSINYTEWDSDHNQFLDTAVTNCFDEVASAGELPADYANDTSDSVRFWAKFLREVVQSQCTVSDTQFAVSSVTNDLPPLPTEEELYIPSLETGSTLSVTANEGFFLNVGSNVQIQVASQTINNASSTTAYEYEIINADSSIVSISSGGELTIHGTNSAIVVIPHLIQVRVSNGNDWGIGQFAIVDIDSDGDNLVDSYEMRVGLNPNVANSLQADTDFDDITDIQEAMLGTLPTERDSDDDNYDDDIELLFDSDPLNGNCNPVEGCRYPIYLPVLMRQ